MNTFEKDDPIITPKGARIYATLKDGWTGRFIDGDSVMLVHPDHPPYLITLSSIEEGDVLPRDTDTAVQPPPGLGGH